MRVRDYSWTIALCLSMLAHAAIIEWRTLRYIEDNAIIHTPGFDFRLFATAVIQQETDQREVELGQDDGRGTSLDASVGDTHMQARLADQDQSFLSRDPEGPGKVGDDPSPSQVSPGENGADGQAAAALVVQQQSQPTPKFASKPPANAVATAPPLPGDQDGPSSPSSKSHVLMAMAPTPPANAPAKKQSSASNAPAGKPGPSLAAADPAPQADTESDPFSTVGSVEFHRGSADVRFGRKHKITRPKLSWNTVFDFFGMTGCECTLDLQLDQTGKVVSAEVVKSSGSESVDQPCRVAAYEWWFEPKRDAAGNAVRDEVQFTLKFF